MNVYVLMYSSREENPVCLGVFKDFNDANDCMKSNVDEIYDTILFNNTLSCKSTIDVEIDDGVASIEYNNMFYNWIIEKTTIK